MRFGLVVFAIAAACGGSGGGSHARNGGEQAIGNQAPAVAVTDPTAAYWCSINSGGYDYPAMPCVLKNVNGRFMLAKLAGSQRFRGVVAPSRDGAGFTFDGEFYCPWGDCSKPLHGVFAPTGDGRLRGTFDDKSVVVTMTPADNGSAGFGGVAYGGDGYGGFGDGGSGNDIAR